MLTKAEKNKVSCQFYSYSLKVLLNELKDFLRKMKRQREKIVLFSEMSLSELCQLQYEDIYHIFCNELTVLNFVVYIEDELLFYALKSLRNKDCDVVVLAYLFSMNDYEISDMLQIQRRTVTAIRNNSLKKLRKYMEEN